MRVRARPPRALSDPARDLSLGHNTHQQNIPQLFLSFFFSLLVSRFV